MNLGLPYGLSAIACLTFRKNLEVAPVLPDCHIQGNSGLCRKHQLQAPSCKRSLTEFDGKMKTVGIVPSSGIWMFHCHVDDHVEAGMATLYKVEPWTATVFAAPRSTRLRKNIMTHQSLKLLLIPTLILASVGMNGQQTQTRGATQQRRAVPSNSSNSNLRPIQGILYLTDNPDSGQGSSATCIR